MAQDMVKTHPLLYSERLSSNKTEALFLALTTLCLLLFIWRVNAGGWSVLAFVFLFLTVLFLFYSINYRTLIIRLTSHSLTLKFGVFSWSVPLDNIADCRLDEIPAFLRYGGAGIHFFMLRNRYRASFNFLDYPRVVVALREKVGPVGDISFSTRRPDEVLRILKEAAEEPASAIPAGS